MDINSYRLRYRSGYILPIYNIHNSKDYVMTTVTRRVMELTQRYVTHGMGLAAARKKALEHANFEREIESNKASTYIKGL